MAGKDNKTIKDAPEKETLIQCPYCNIVEPMPEDRLKGHMVDDHWPLIMSGSLSAPQVAAPGPTPEDRGDRTPGIIPEKNPDLELRLDNVERGLAKVVEYITGQPRSAPDQVQPGGQPGQQIPPGSITGNPLLDLGVQKALGIGPPEDPFAEIGRMYVKEGLRASIAGQRSYYSRLGRALGADAVKEADAEVNRIFGEKHHVTSKPKGRE